MVYSAVHIPKVKAKIGKGGREVSGADDGTPIISAALFSKVYINDQLIPDGKFVLLITKDTSESHAGRLRLKYSPSNTYIDNGLEIKNQDFFKLVQRQFELSENACWFISHINVVNQDILVLKTVFVDKNSSRNYENTIELHKCWDPLIEEVEKIERTEYFDFPHNCIFYGVPGAGKSFTVNSTLERIISPIRNIFEEHIRRIIFHPDYTYGDLVGQIMPTTKVGGGVEYKFIAGPFAEIMRMAYDNPLQNCALVIEELNRGNAPAIFGELFQLLDRDETTGNSTFSIYNKELAKYVYYLSDDDASKKPIKLPANLYIIATMNTSDQNVFVMDTAFQRRWQMKHIKNKFADENDIRAKKTISGTKIYWGVFAETVNGILSTDESLNFGMGSNEDKGLGVYFASVKDLENKERFAEKILKYLWDDAFKLNRSALFKSEFKTLTSLIEAFVDAPDNVDALEVVLENKDKKNIYNDMKNRMSEYNSVGIEEITKESSNADA